MYVTSSVGEEKEDPEETHWSQIVTADSAPVKVFSVPRIKSATLIVVRARTAFV